MNGWKKKTLNTWPQVNGKDDQKDEGRKTAAAKPQKPEKVETKFGKSFINRLVGNAIGNIQVTAKLASWQENSRNAS